MNEYIIAFSSFYKAVYAQEKLQEQKIKSSLRKTPANLLRSCGYSLYVRTANITPVREVLSRNGIEAKGIFMIERRDNQLKYIAV